MTAGGKESDDLEKLLADVQRTIRENDQFIRHLKEEAVDCDGADASEDPDGDAEGGEYEEL